MNDFLTRFRLLPLLLLVALAAFAVRMGDTFLGVRDMAAGVLAQPADVAFDFDLAQVSPASGDVAPAASAASAAPTNGQDAKLPEVGDEATPNFPANWADPDMGAIADSPGQLQLFEDLSARRTSLDARERSILAREAILAASEKQIDEKLAELRDLKNQIEDLLGQQDQKEQERINSLVKIYEGMKARDAAGIFNQMDMDILVQVVSRMSERKSAPIIAAMDKLKANQLTVMLSEMDKLPAARTDFRGIAGGPVPTQAPAGSAPLPGLDALGAP